MSGASNTTNAYDIPPSKELFSLLPEAIKTKIFTHCFASVSLHEGSKARNVRGICCGWRGAALTAERMMYIDLQQKDKEKRDKQLPQDLIPLTEVLGTHPTDIPKDDPSQEGPTATAVEQVSRKMVEVAERHGVILPEHTIFLNQTQLQELQIKAQEQNSALELFWKESVRQSLLSVPGAPQNEIPSADAPAATLRAFLRDPARAELLSKVENLSLLGYPNITVVPSEMRLLRGLKLINLTDTDLREAPDVSEYPLLECLFLRRTKIKIPSNVSTNLALQELDLAGNSFLERAPDVRKNSALTKLILFSTNIAGPLDVSQNSQLTCLSLSNTRLKKAPDVRGNPRLTFFDLHGTSIQEGPDVSENPALEYFFLSSTQIKEAPNVSKNLALKSLALNSTQIKKPPDLRNNRALEALCLFRNDELEEAPDLSENLCLEHVDLSQTRIRIAPNLSKHTRLKVANFAHTDLQEPPHLPEHKEGFTVNLEGTPYALKDPKDSSSGDEV